MLTIHSMPELRTPTMLCAFSGWPDAGSAASGAVEYLIAKWAPRRFADLDPRAIYVQSTQRPNVKIVRTDERRLRWPRLALYALPIPHAARDLVLLVGPEPDLRWRTCAQALLDLAERLACETVLTLGAFLGPVPHTGIPVLSGRSNRPELRRTLSQLGLQDGTYEGPTGFPTALLDAATKRGFGVASIWAASPIYLRSLSNPKLAAALLGIVERLLKVDVGLAELEVAGRDLERRIDRELASRPDLQQFVERLSRDEDNGDIVEATGLPIEERSGGEMPNADELLRDVDSYLRRMRDDEPGA